MLFRIQIITVFLLSLVSCSTNFVGTLDIKPKQFSNLQLDRDILKQRFLATCKKKAFDIKRIRVHSFLSLSCSKGYLYNIELVEFINPTSYKLASVYRGKSETNFCGDLNYFRDQLQGLDSIKSITIESYPNKCEE